MNVSTVKPILILGLGNPLQGDDGVGCRVAQEQPAPAYSILLKPPEPYPVAPAGVGCTMPGNDSRPGGGMQAERMCVFVSAHEWLANVW